MTHRSRQEINQLISQHALLPLFNPDDLEVSKNVIRAAYEGGVRLFECTNRSADAYSIFKQLVPYVQTTMPEMVLGAGTIMDEEAAQRFYQAGAQFIVSPVISPDVADFCKKNNLFWCPGASTLNEIITAQNMGADIVKIFPANFLGGPEFVKAIKAPCPWIRVMPTGGVDGSEKNLRAWFEAGVACVGIGSQLFTRETLAARDYKMIATRTKEIVTTIQSIRSAPTQKITPVRS
jgi:2-dehydro-3-deoxyphosphogluconate aldolase/(4S)-4-hydroxy-2-oxoglutarate aldolase